MPIELPPLVFDQKPSLNQQKQGKALSSATVVIQKLNLHLTYLVGVQTVSHQSSQYL